MTISPGPGGRDLTVIIPCYNESSQVMTTVNEVRGWFDGSDVEIVFVDDGSTDDTAQHLRLASAIDPRTRVITLPENRGKGAAIKAGLSAGTAGRVLMMDADLAYDRASAERALAALEHADVVVGNRRHPESRYFVPVRLFGFLWRRHLAGLAFNAFVRTLLRLPFRDTQCGLKCFRREAAERIGALLSVNRFAFDVELLLIARGMGARIVDVPVSVSYEGARSSVALMKVGGSAAREVASVAWRRLSGAYRAPDMGARAAAARPQPVSPPHSPVDGR